MVRMYLWEGLVWRVVLGLQTVEWCWHTDGHYLGPTSFLPKKYKLLQKENVRNYQTNVKYYYN